MCVPVINVEKSGRKIKELCDARGYSPQKLRDALGMESVQGIYKWFSGQNIPSIDNLVRLSRLLDVALDELLVTNDVDV